MEGIKIEVTGNIARVIEKPVRITSGTVGLPVEFTFDSQWGGLSKVAVFRAGHTAITTDLPGTSAIVPWEVLKKPKAWLHIGVYGANADGTVVIPTIWVNVCPIYIGVDPDGEQPKDPSPTLWQDLRKAFDGVSDKVDGIAQEVDATKRLVNDGIETMIERTDAIAIQHAQDKQELDGEIDALNHKFDNLDIEHPVKQIDNTNSGTITVLHDLTPGLYMLKGFFPFNSYLDEGLYFGNHLVEVYEPDAGSKYVQFWDGWVNRRFYITSDDVHGDERSLFWMETTENRVPTIDENSDDEHYPTAKATWDAIQNHSGSSSGGLWMCAEIDPTKQLSAQYLASAYKAAFYTSLPDAVADLNAGTIGENADATADNAVCALYTDYDGNTCLTLLSNIELAELVTISAENVVFRINGYTVNIACAGYAFTISGKVTIDGRVNGSSMKQAVSANSVNTALLYVPGNLNLLGGSFDVSSEAASKFVACIANSGNTAIDGCSISATVNGGTATCYGINNADTLKAHNSTISATAESEGGLAYPVSTTNKSVDMIMNGCKIAGRSNKIIVGVVIQSASDKPYEIINCDIEVTGATARAINVVNSGIVENCLVNTFGATESTGVKNINNTSNLTIRNCTIFADGTTGSVNGISNSGAMTIENCTIFADGTTGSVNDAEATGKIASDGIINFSTMTIENCTVFGTHTGVQCSGGSTTVINGGVYESCSHGGVYISCVGGNFYAQNATFKNVPYRGNHKDIYSYTQAVYMDAAVYIGGSSTSSDIKAYMDNCIMDGTGPCLAPNGDEFIGAEPIRFRGSLGEKNNHIYASNCTLMGDGQIRFASSSHRLYLGYGNRVLCEASIPSCVDSTTYAKKVFTSYE